MAQEAVARIKYADWPDEKFLEVREIATWDRGDITAPVMSASSGPKDYVKNQIWSIFDTQPRINRVVIVRASGPPFAIVRDVDNCWFDMAGKQIVRGQQRKAGVFDAR